jgi:CubicO group peptidase (beta-lactamase class C family)
MNSGLRRRVLGVMAAVAAISLVAAGCSDDDSPSGSEPVGDTSPEIESGGEETSSSAIDRATVDGSFEVLDGIVTEVMEETGVPGVAVAVVYDDEVLYEQGYGVRTVDADDPVDADTVFQIASLSKPISSTIMSGLVGQGVFEWDDPIQDHAPQFELSDDLVSERVTFADLFSHRSGLPGGPAGNDLEGVGYDRDTILPLLALVPLDGFRDTYSYSNWAMTLGGEVGAITAGSDWETISEEVLFDPAGMDNTSMRYDDLLANENRAELHVPSGEKEWAAEVTRDPQPQAPAGGVSSNVGDLAQWIRLQLADGELDGETIIDPEALAQTHVPHITSRPPNPPDGGQPGLYGLGWSLSTEFGGLVTWAHAGAFSNGASTMAKLVPAEGLGIVVLTNGAPVGVPEAITDAYVDYLVTGEDNTTDWLSLWTERMGGIYGEPLDLGPEPAEPEPAAASEAYEGTYSNAYVGNVTITAGEGDTLEMAIGAPGNTYTLDHWDGDTFVYNHDRELPDFLETAIFELVDGQAVSLTLSAMNGARLGTLDRT